MSGRRCLRASVYITLVAGAFAWACTFMGIPSLAVPNWEEYQIDSAYTNPSGFFYGKSHSRGMFKICEWNGGNCEALSHSYVSNPAYNSNLIIDLRRVHAAFMIMAIILGFVAGLLALVMLVIMIIRVNRGDWNERPVKFLCLAASAICIVGVIFYTIAMICFHVRVGEEAFVYSPTNSMSETMGSFAARYLTGDTLIRYVSRYYSSMYGLAWGSYGALLIAAILFTIPPCFYGFGYDENSPDDSEMFVTSGSSSGRRTSMYSESGRTDISVPQRLSQTPDIYYAGRGSTNPAFSMMPRQSYANQAIVFS